MIATERKPSSHAEYRVQISLSYGRKHTQKGESGKRIPGVTFLIILGLFEAKMEMVSMEADKNDIVFFCCCCFFQEKK